MMKQRMMSKLRSLEREENKWQRKGLVIRSVDKDDSEDSDEVGEQEEFTTGTETPIDSVPVAMKTPSVAAYKIIKQGEKGVYQIVREDGTYIVYINFGAMLKSISRDDLTELYRIVMNRYGMDGHKVHCLNLESMEVYMLSERKYPLSAEYLKKAQSVNPRLYDIGCYNDNLALMLAPESDETVHLAQESRSKLISPDMKILIEQKLNPTAKRLTNDIVEFYQTLKEEMVEDFKIVKSLKNEFESLQSQLKLQQTQFSNEIDRLSREYYYDDHMNAILGAYNNIDEYSGMACDYLEVVAKCELLANELSK
ncbi:hypothetical protein Tco_1121324 [Tanacetum coccineum]|uniref:Uncharacterized protein n=1 Tax=Tanacetum coccineum TaxID=301880 RepID=A0ABQ5IXK8_9ASTR